MSIHIIIDGYNLIRQSHRLSALDRQDLQMGREALLDSLAAYRRLRSHRITVVFDGTNAPQFSHRRDNIKGISVRYSRIGETADTVIKRMIRKEREKALVVSSDRELIHSAESHGAAAVSSPDFEAKMTLAIQMGDSSPPAPEDKGWTPTTKKKGPRRRLPKKRRKSRIKLDKL